MSTIILSFRGIRQEGTDSVNVALDYAEGSNLLFGAAVRRYHFLFRLLASFFSKACDSKTLFDQLAVADAKEYEEHRNQKVLQGSGAAASGFQRRAEAVV